MEDFTFSQIQNQEWIAYIIISGVDSDTYTRLKKTAFEKNVSMATIIEKSILEYLQRLEREEKK